MKNKITKIKDTGKTRPMRVSWAVLIDHWIYILEQGTVEESRSEVRADMKDLATRLDEACAAEEAAQDVTVDGIKGGQGRTAESVRSDAIGMMWLAAFALLAFFILWMIN